MRASSAAFVAVYAPATAAGVRLLRGTARRCAAIALAVLAGGARQGRWIGSATAPSRSCT